MLGDGILPNLASAKTGMRILATVPGLGSSTADNSFKMELVKSSGSKHAAFKSFCMSSKADKK